MPSWGIVDTANNKPVYVPDANVVYGVDVAEVGVNPKVAHAGWVQVEYGVGPVLSVAVSNGGTGYTNGAATVTGDSTRAANTVFVTNSTGGVTSITTVDGGDGYIAAPAITGGGTGGVFVASMGGRVGRVRYETLVATGAITGDDEDTVFPDS